MKGKKYYELYNFITISPKFSSKMAIHIKAYNRVVSQIRERNSLIILRKNFVSHHKDIRHTGGTIKIVFLENAKMFELQMTLPKI